MREAPKNRLVRTAAPLPAGAQKGRAGVWRMLRMLRMVGGVVLVVATAGLTAGAARWYVTTSSRFHVASVVTTGNHVRSPDELVALAGLVKGQSVWDVDVERARILLMADPWIAEAVVSRRLPATVAIHVTERVAAGVVALSDGQTCLVTREGQILKRVEPSDPLDFPVVTGITLVQLSDDREGSIRAIARALDLASAYDHAPMAQRAPLQEVHVQASGEMSLVVGQSGVSLAMGAPPYHRKLYQAGRVLAELDRRGGRAEVIMLDNEAHPERVVARMR